MRRPCDHFIDGRGLREPPRFASGLGWQGSQIERLSAGVPIFVCRELDLEFGLTTRTWVQIGYRTAGDWRYGWISKESVRIAVRTDGLIKRLYASIPSISIGHCPT